MMHERTPGGYVKVTEWESFIVCYDTTRVSFIETEEGQGDDEWV